jgi:hypothetical protein
MLGETAHARSLIGKARKEHGDLAVLAAVERCESEHPSDPLPFFLGCLKAAGKQSAKPSAPDPAVVTEAPWAARLRGWKPGKFWSPNWGPPPGDPSCFVPPEFLKQAGFA